MAWDPSQPPDFTVPHENVVYWHWQLLQFTFVSSSKHNLVVVMLSSREFCRAASGKASGSDNKVRTLKYSVVITPFIISTFPMIASNINIILKLN